MEHSTPSRTSPNPFLANSPSDVVTGNFVLPTLSSSPLIPEGAKTVPTTPQGKSQSPIVVGKRFLRREYAFILSPDVSPNNDSRKVDLRTWLAGDFANAKPMLLGTSLFWKPRLADLDISRFNPHTPESYFKLKAQLDACRNAGVSEDQFRTFFIQCSNCRRVMTRRSREYHTCADILPSDDLRNLDVMILQLDCYGGTHGVLDEHFELLFAQCTDCDLYMTRWAAMHHSCEEGKDV